MKISVKILIAAASLLIVQTLAAQTPAISTKYTDAEIAQIVNNYRAAHSRDVFPPDTLQQKFQADFPKARDVEWETANDIYEVEFEIRFRDFRALYDKSGNLLMVVEEIRPSELPAVVRNTAEGRYPKFHFEDMEKIRRGTETVYKIEMEKSFSDMEVKLLVDSGGKILEERFDY
jgi:hypothetical protein